MKMLVSIAILEGIHPDAFAQTLADSSALKEYATEVMSALDKISREKINEDFIHLCSQV